jgi:hypothetical protein
VRNEDMPATDIMFLVLGTVCAGVLPERAIPNRLVDVVAAVTLRVAGPKIGDFVGETIVAPVSVERDRLLDVHRVDDPVPRALDVSPTIQSPTLAPRRIAGLQHASVQ